MLQQAFNTLMAFNGRYATLRRYTSSSSISTSIRLAASQYYRNQESIASTTVKGREFVIQASSMNGYPIEKVLLGGATSGTFKLTNNAGTTGDLDFDASSSDVQTAIRLLTGYSQIVVTGNNSTGYLITFLGVEIPDLFEITDNNLSGGDTPSTAFYSYQQWSPRVKRGDKIELSDYGNLAITDVMEMTDVGGAVIGYRVRCE